MLYRKLLMGLLVAGLLLVSSGSSRGFWSYPAFFRSLALKASALTISSPPGLSLGR